MLFQTFVTQPTGGVNYLSLFEEAFERVTIKKFDVAVAYATLGGVAALDKVCRELDASAWVDMKKRWLVGIDYCRTEPLAIRRLQELPNSKVRIHAGKVVVARKQCTPILPFHPKLFLLGGPKTFGAICGSGNLSRNGLTKGHEVGSLTLAHDPSSPEEVEVANIYAQLATWHTAGWSEASEVNVILKQYEETYDAVDQLRSPAPTDDDTSDTDSLAIGKGNRRALGPMDLRRLRACRHLWIEAGKLTKNRGVLKPGNQLMLTPMTRVFFGFDASDVQKDTAIGDVTITYGNQTRPDCSLVFSNNAMDKLTLPVPDNGGPASYDGKNILIEKRSDGGFVLTLGAHSDKNRWIKRSQAIEGYRRMSSGRQWGVF